MGVLHRRGRRDSHWVGFKNENTSCVRFLIFKPRLICQTYTERRRLAPDYMGSNTHTHQGTQLTIVTNVIEREFVATAILSLYLVLRFRSPSPATRFKGAVYTVQHVFLSRFGCFWSCSRTWALSFAFLMARQSASLWLVVLWYEYHLPPLLGGWRDILP